MAAVSARNNMPQKPHHGLLMDLRRKEQLIEARPIDHIGEALELENPAFDVSKTIFKHLDEKSLPMIRNRYAKQLFWADSAVARLERKTAEELARNRRWADLQAPSPELLKFMTDECEFNCEHSDGSFLEHLQFCYEFGCMHMPTHSAMPLFLHSIMGVGTNLFPMKLEKRPRLAELVSAEDLVHIESFPSVLRLLYSSDFERKLSAMPTEELGAINEFECYRLIGPDVDHDGLVGKSDNAPLKLNSEQFWVHLNYQLVHLTDFVPALSWKEKLNNHPFALVVKLMELLKRAGKLYVHLNFDSSAWTDQVVFEKMGTAMSERIGFRMACKLTINDTVHDFIRVEYDQTE